MELEQQALYGTPGAPCPPAAPAPAGENLSQMAFFSSEPPQNFLQTRPVSRPPQQNQNQTVSRQGCPEGAQNPGALLASGLRPSIGQPESRSLPRFLGPPGPDPVQPAARPLSHPEGQACRFGPEPVSSSPSSPLACLPGENSSLKRKKRDGDEAGAGTPLSSHSDDITAIPAVLDSSCSGPTPALPSVPSPQVKVSHHQHS